MIYNVFEIALFQLVELLFKAVQGVVLDHFDLVVERHVQLLLQHVDQFGLDFVGNLRIVLPSNGLVVLYSVVENPNDRVLERRNLLLAGIMKQALHLTLHQLLCLLFDFVAPIVSDHVPLVW